MTCCALHNWLLEVDGLADGWENGGKSCNGSSFEGLPYLSTDKYIIFIIMFKWHYACLLIKNIYNINYYFINNYLVLVS